MKYRLRMIEFVGDQEFTQGYGMTWDPVVIDIPSNEYISHVEATFTTDGCGFEGQRPVVRVWLISPLMLSDSERYTPPEPVAATKPARTD